MVAYRQSDVKFSWDKDSLPFGQVGPKICGYVREGEELKTNDNNDDITTNEWTSPHHQVKRQADQYEYSPTKTRCPLLLVADYRFFQEMGASNTKTTINYLVCIEDKLQIFLLEKQTCYKCNYTDLFL